MIKKLLHVGCGPKTKAETTFVYASDEWEETRLDIDETIEPKPDIIASMVNMEVIEDKSFDAVFSSHNIEHLYPHEVGIALKEFFRVLKDDGEAYIKAPDLKGIAKHVAEDNLLEPLYQSPAGPIAAIDMIYGHRASLQAGKHYMAHKCGFTPKALLGVLKGHGFNSAIGTTDGLNMEVLAVKNENQEAFIKKRIEEHIGRAISSESK